MGALTDTEFDKVYNIDDMIKHTVSKILYRIIEGMDLWGALTDAEFDKG